MRINQNIPAMSAHRALTTSQSGVQKATERLASGLRINRAADDAAGLAISEGLRAQVGGLTQAQRNVGDGISLLQTAEGGLNETHAILQRMRTLAVQAANSGVMSQDSLGAIQTEMNQLTADIDHIAGQSQFNGMNLLDGSFKDKVLQVGANSGDTETLTISSGLKPATSGSPAGVALWDVFQPSNLAGIGSTVTVTQASSAGESSIDVPIGTKPTSVTDLAAQLNANADFAAKYEAKVDYHTFSDGTRIEAANLVIMAKSDGAAAISVSGIPAASTQTNSGTDALPEREGGFGSADLLGGFVNVTGTMSGGGGGGVVRGFGFGDDSVTPTTGTGTMTWSSSAGDAIAQIDRAIAVVSDGRASIGAVQNGLEHTATNLGVSAENLSAADSRIRDADMAKEMASMQRWQIIQQASTAMLAQANQAPQNVLKLLA